MATVAQIEANRGNAQSSTGPRTDQGKQAVSRNATSHGLSGAHVIIAGEDPQAYNTLLAALCAEHAPAGPTAEFLIHQMAQSQWKLNRIARMEAELFTPSPELLKAAPDASPVILHTAAFASNPTLFLSLSRYEATARRAYFQALKQLITLHKQTATEPRPAAPPKPVQSHPVFAFDKTNPIPVIPPTFTPEATVNVTADL